MIPSEEKTVVAFLFRHGLLRTTCPECHCDGKLEDVDGMEFHRLSCKCGYRRSSKNATVLDDHGIGDIPLFIFVIKCFLLRVSTKAIIELSGAHEDTVHTYLKAVRSVLCSRFENEVRNPDFMFGGPGKIVEVDEAFISKRKYGHGRRQPKEGIWVVGITEVDDPTQRIEDQEFLRAMKKREADRQTAAERRVRRRKPKQSSGTCTLSAFSSRREARMVSLMVPRRGSRRRTSSRTRPRPSRGSRKSPVDSLNRSKTNQKGHASSSSMQETRTHSPRSSRKL